MVEVDTPVRLLTTPMGIARSTLFHRLSLGRREGIIDRSLNLIFFSAFGSFNQDDELV